MSGANGSPPAGAGEVAERLAAVRARIAAAGGDPDRITVVGVTKGVGSAAVPAALAAGLHDLGENYAQELAAKAAAVEGAPVRWHFLGQVQRNKVKLLAPIVHLWQSVDRMVAGEEIARRAPGAAVLVQVRVSGEAQKGGCSPAHAKVLVSGLRGIGLDVRGLMAVGYAGSPAEVRPGFRLLASLARDLGLPELSMGMTDDLEVAVQEGSTIVRVGRALFGPRPSRENLRR